ncbi:MAG: hypothetical protein V7K26_33240 [Nostoc sp.]
MLVDIDGKKVDGRFMLCCISSHYNPSVSLNAWSIFAVGSEPIT